MHWNSDLNKWPLPQEVVRNERFLRIKKTGGESPKSDEHRKFANLPPSPPTNCVSPSFDSHLLRRSERIRQKIKVNKLDGGGGPRSVMVTTPDSHAGGPGFKSRCRPTNFGAHLPHTPPPGRKDASRVPKGMVYAKAEHPG